MFVTLIFLFGPLSTCPDTIVGANYAAIVRRSNDLNMRRSDLGKWFGWGARKDRNYIGKWQVLTTKSHCKWGGGGLRCQEELLLNGNLCRNPRLSWFKRRAAPRRLLPLVWPDLFITHAHTQHRICLWNSQNSTTTGRRRRQDIEGQTT